MSPVVTTCSASSLHQREPKILCCWVLVCPGQLHARVGVTRSTTQLPAWCSSWGLLSQSLQPPWACCAIRSCPERRCSIWQHHQTYCLPVAAWLDTQGCH